MDIDIIAEKVFNNIYGNELNKEKSFFMYIEEETSMVCRIVLNNGSAFGHISKSHDEDSLRYSLIFLNRDAIESDCRWIIKNKEN